MNELELLDKFEEDMGLTEWEKEDLPIILEILEERMLMIDRVEQEKHWRQLELYYNCVKGNQANYNFKQIGFDSFDVIKKELIENNIIPTDQEMQRLIDEKRKNGNIKTIELKVETNQKVEKIIGN